MAAATCSYRRTISSLKRCRKKLLHAIRSTAHMHACSSDSIIALQLLTSTATIDLSRSTVAWKNRSGATALLWYMLQYVSGSWEWFLSLAALMRSIDGADFVRRLQFVFVGRERSGALAFSVRFVDPRDETSLVRFARTSCEWLSQSCTLVFISLHA